MASCATSGSATPAGPSAAGRGCWALGRPTAGPAAAGRVVLAGRWSSPAGVKVEGGSFGFQIGGSETDVVMLVTNEGGAKKLLSNKFTLGADASVATGPVGRQGSAATDMTFHAEIYTYARTRGLFGGIALDGSVISIDRPANAALYGKSGGTATEIFSGQSPAAPGNWSLV